MVLLLHRIAASLVLPPQGTFSSAVHKGSGPASQRPLCYITYMGNDLHLSLFTLYDGNFATLCGGRVLSSRSDHRFFVRRPPLDS